MSKRSASIQAAEWAEKKRQQLERAQQLKEERKSQIRRVAEVDIVGASNGFSQVSNGGGGGYNDFGGGNSKYNSGMGGARNNGAMMSGGGGGFGNEQLGSYGRGKQSQPSYNNDPFGGGGGRADMKLGGNAGYGYQGGKMAPVKAMDFGFDSGIGGNNGGGFGGYENTVSGKGMNGAGSSNYRKPFNPNMQESQSSIGYKGSTTTSSSYQKPPSQQSNRRMPQSNSKRTIDPPSDNRYGNVPKGKSTRLQPQEESKYDNYQPQKREAPGRKVAGGPSSGMNKPSSYANYDDEVSKQVIPAVSKGKAGGGFGKNIPPEAFQSPQNMDLTPCPSCQRSFNPEAYKKHVKICKKVFVQKRKEFNSQAHRIVSSEHKQILVQAKRQENVQQKTGAMGGRGGGYQNQPIKMSNKAKWKAQSDQFRAAMRAARMADMPGGGYGNQKGGGGGGYGAKGGKSGGGGGGYNYQPPPEEYDDRTPCPYCGRKFNDVAAQRHIPHCQAKTKEAAMRVGGKSGFRR